MKQVLVIQEGDTIIGVASTVEKSFEMIKEYYGESFKTVNIQHIGQNGLDYVCEVYTKEDGGTTYSMAVYYFTIDEV